MNKIIIVLFCVLYLVGCKIVEAPIQYNSDSDSYVVKQITRLKNQLYIVDLERSDSVFRIFSHFDGKKNDGYIKLHKHDKVKVELIVPTEFQRLAIWEQMNPLDVRTVMYGVDVSKYFYRNTFRFPYYFEGRYCDDLNGRYLKSKKE